MKIKQLVIARIYRLKWQHVHNISTVYIGFLKITPKKANNQRTNISLNESIGDQENQCAIIFNMPIIKKMCRKHKLKQSFSHQLETDGISVSILYSTHKVEHDSSIDDRLLKIRAKYESGFYENEIGVDLLYNTYVEALKINPSNQIKSIFKIKSKQFHRSTKNNIRKKRFRRLACSWSKSRSRPRKQW